MRRTRREALPGTDSRNFDVEAWAAARREHYRGNHSRRGAVVAQLPMTESGTWPAQPKRSTKGIGNEWGKTSAGCFALQTVPPTTKVARTGMIR